MEGGVEVLGTQDWAPITGTVMGPLQESELEIKAGEGQVGL